MGPVGCLPSETHAHGSSRRGREQSLTCLVDDEQWLDQGSGRRWGFVARRLAADPAARPPPHAAIMVTTMSGG